MVIQAVGKGGISVRPLRVPLVRVARLEHTFHGTGNNIALLFQASAVAKFKDQVAKNTLDVVVKFGELFVGVVVYSCLRCYGVLFVSMSIIYIIKFNLSSILFNIFCNIL